MKASRSEGTAYHEAGHAVVGYLLGFDPYELAIKPDRTSGARGRVSGVGGPLLPMPDRAPAMDRQLRMKTENEVVVLLSGILAEAKRTGRYNWLGAAGDLEQADRLLIPICSTPHQQVDRRRRLEKRAQQIIDQRATWRAVESVAAELVNRSRLSGAEALGLIRAALVAEEP